MASSQLAKLSTTFRPNHPVYISLSFEITWFNQQQGMEMRMCHHVAIIPPGYFSCSQKTCYPWLKPLGFNQSLPWIIHVLQGVTQFGNRWVFTVRVRNTQRWVGKRSWIFGNCWNITALRVEICATDTQGNDGHGKKTLAWELIFPDRD